MSGSGISRRDFMQIVGLGGLGALAAAATRPSNPAPNSSSPTFNRKFVVPRRRLLRLDLHAMPSHADHGRVREGAS